MPHAHFVYGDDYLGTLLSTVRAWGEPGTTQIILCENPTDPEGIGILTLSAAETYSPALSAAAFDANAQEWWDPVDGIPRRPKGVGGRLAARPPRCRSFASRGLDHSSLP